MKGRVLTQERLRNILNYNQGTGIFMRLVDRRGGRWKAGARAGCHDKFHHCRVLRIDGRCYLEHRVVWLYVHGRWPTLEIDHINGDGTDNRLCNLREATHQQNMRNMKKHKDNTSGFKGVYFNKKTGKWVTQIAIASRQTYVGSFDTPESAHTEYCRVATANFGKFANFGV